MLLVKGESTEMKLLSLESMDSKDFSKLSSYVRPDCGNSLPLERSEGADIEGLFLCLMNL